MDVLSEILSICRSERAVTARFALTAPWGLRSAGVSGAMIRMGRGAPYWIALPGTAPVQVEPDDLVMLPLGAPHVLLSSPGQPTTPFADLIARHAQGPLDENPLVFAHGDGGALTDMFSAQVWFSAYCRHSVFTILPPLIHIRAQQLPLASGLADTMEALTKETLDRRPGWRLSAGRMGELLLVNILREHLATITTTTTTSGTGWLRGLSDPGVARAIGCVHRTPGQALDGADAGQRGRHVTLGLQRAFQGAGGHYPHPLPHPAPHGPGRAAAGGGHTFTATDCRGCRLRVGQGVCPGLPALGGRDPHRLPAPRGQSAQEPDRRPGALSGRLCGAYRLPPEDCSGSTTLSVRSTR